MCDEARDYQGEDVMLMLFLEVGGVVGQKAKYGVLLLFVRRPHCLFEERLEPLDELGGEWIGSLKEGLPDNGQLMQGEIGDMGGQQLHGVPDMGWVYFEQAEQKIQAGLLGEQIGALLKGNSRSSNEHVDFFVYEGRLGLVQQTPNYLIVVGRVHYKMETQKLAFQTSKQLFQSIEHAFISSNTQALPPLLKYLYSSQCPEQAYHFNATVISGASIIGGAFGKILHLLQQYFSCKCQRKQKQRFEVHLKVLDAVLKCLGAMQEGEGGGNEWLQSLLIIVSMTKRVVNSVKKDQESEKMLKSAVDKLRDFRRARSLNPSIKEAVMSLSDVQQMSISLSMHDYGNVKNILVAKSHAETYPPYRNNFMFQKGKYSLINSSFSTAVKCLESIQIHTEAQKRLVLKYLIPCKMFLGQVYAFQEGEDSFPEYSAISKAILAANFVDFQKANTRFQRVWLKRGIYLLMDHLRVILWRNLIRRVSAVSPTSSISFELIEKAVRIQGGQESQNEILCIVSNLVYAKYIRAYIYHNDALRFLVLAKSQAFPKLSTVPALQDG